MFLGQEKEHKDIVKFDGLLTIHYNPKNVEKKENEKLVFANNNFRIILVFSVFLAGQSECVTVNFL